MRYELILFNEFFDPLTVLYATTDVESVLQHRDRLQDEYAVLYTIMVRVT